MVLDKLKSLAIDKESLRAAGPAAPVGKPPTKKAIYQNRYNFGVNFGSLFVLEKFIFDKFFIDDTNTELDAIKAYQEKNGSETTRKDLEDHWNNFVTDQDWQWLKSKGVTAVRIPIGYWHVNGGLFASDTDFSSVAGLYKNAWVIFKNIVRQAKEHEIGVLVDLHALPGGANTAEHSGCSLKKADFWKTKKYEKIALSILEFLADDLKNEENLVGIQIVNESEFDNTAASQKHYYTKAVKHIRKINKEIPIVISDGWWADQWVKWVTENEQDLKNQSVGVVIDDHVYRCFSDSDKAKSPEQIIKDLDGDLLTNLSGEADIIVGEYSCVLDGASWDKAGGDRNQLVKQYGNELSRLFFQRARAGSYFWTFKFEHGDGGEWGFVPQVETGAIPSRPTQVTKLPSDDEVNKILENELNQHSQYWDNQNKNEKYEHWRYKEAFITAWSDAKEFSNFNGSTIGRLSAWKSARRNEHINHRNNSKFLWEWDQGFDKAISVFHQVAFS